MMKRIMSCLSVIMTIPIFASGKDFGPVLVVRENIQASMPKTKTVSFVDDLDTEQFVGQFKDEGISRDDSGRNSTVGLDTEQFVEQFKDEGISPDDSVRNSTVDTTVMKQVVLKDLKDKLGIVEAHGTKTPSVRDDEDFDHQTNTPSPERKDRVASLFRILSVGSTTSLADHQTDTPSPKNKRKFGEEVVSRLASTNTFGSFRSVHSAQNLTDHVTHTPSDNGNRSARRLDFPSGPSSTSLSEEVNSNSISSVEQNKEVKFDY